MSDWLITCLPHAVLAAASFIFSLTGFGYALVTVPLLALLMPLKQAIILQLPFGLLLIIYHAWVYRRHIRWRELWPMFLGGAVGIPLGVLSLQTLPEFALRVVMSLFIITAVVTARLPMGRGASRVLRKWRGWGAVFGGLAGWSGGAFTAPGPPAVIYVMAVQDDMEMAKGYMASFFAFISLWGMTAFYAGGLLTAESLSRAPLYLPAVFGGFFLGRLAAGRTGEGLKRAVAHVLLMIMAVLLLYRG